MILIGTKKEYFEATWVKNEWRRFKEMVKQDATKRIFVAYADMNAYDLPDEIRSIQAADMRDMTFFNDILSNINSFMKEIGESFEERNIKQISATLEKMGEKSADNLIAAIEKSKENDLSKLIFALGIRHVGAANARNIAMHFGTLDAVIAAKEEEILAVENDTITVKRRLERGVEVVKGRLPMLVTVNGSAAACRSRHAKLTLKYKLAKTQSEVNEIGADYTEIFSNRPYLKIDEWSVNDIEHDPKWLGMSGSPTKVKQIENVVFTAKESKRLEPTDAEIDGLMKELIANHTIG